MKAEILGRYAVTNKYTIRPEKRCLDCPFFSEGDCWCSRLRKKIENWAYNEECPIIEITIEEI
jgi:hypothetical protein